jgi:hypothetical protein
MSLSPTLVDRIVRHVNRKEWWHVPPQDPQAYLKRGVFFSPSFAEAEFWGRPLDDPQKIKISCPLIGDEQTIEKRLFGRRVSNEEISVKKRWLLDARMKKAALARSYDSIVLMTPNAFSAFQKKGKVPRSIEMNLLEGI